MSWINANIYIRIIFLNIAWKSLIYCIINYSHSLFQHYESFISSLSGRMFGRHFRAHWKCNTETSATGENIRQRLWHRKPRVWEWNKCNTCTCMSGNSLERHSATHISNEYFAYFATNKFWPCCRCNHSVHYKHAHAYTQTPPVMFCVCVSLPQRRIKAHGHKVAHAFPYAPDSLSLGPFKIGIHIHSFDKVSAYAQHTIHTQTFKHNFWA